MPTTDLPRPAPGAVVALADRCVQCGLCLPHCPTYALDRVETESPRGRIAYMKAVAEGSLAPTPAGDQHLEHCLGCRRCEGACPAGVEYGALLLAGRAERFERRGLSAALGRRLGLLARPRLLSALLDAYRLAFPLLPRRWRPLPRPPRHVAVPQGASARPGATAVFVGCVAHRYEEPTRAALFRLASAAGLELELPSGQGCCGAAAAHAGDAAQAATLAAVNRRAFAGRERVLCLASGCQSSLADALRGSTRVEDASVALARRADRLRFRDAGGRKLAWHRPCTQFALPGSVAALRALLARVPGLDVVELPDTGCCGAAGTHMLEFPERAARLRANVLKACADSGAEEIVSANIGCRLHLADGGAVRVRHPLELLAEFLA
jgi:glycolate oxidase iron-sulfur subunit